MDCLPRGWRGAGRFGGGAVRALRAAFALIMAAPVLAQPADNMVTGHYYLQGVRETGSELLIKPDGRFEWYLSYGAVDEFANGNWRRDGAKLLLEADLPDPALVTLTEDRREEWDASTELALREAINDTQLAAAREACPFLDDVAVTASPPTEADPPPPPAADALQRLDEARVAAEKAMAAAAAALDNPALVDAARDARRNWREAWSIYSSAARAEGASPEMQPEAAIPQQCGLRFLPTEEPIAPSEWLRGIAVMVHDPNAGLRLRGFDVDALYADGRSEMAYEFGSKMAFLEKRPGHNITQLTITAPWLPPAGRTLPIQPVEDGVIFLAIDSSKLREPPFKRLELMITADGLTNAEWLRGTYRKQ
jgi:hypothetical protein